MGKKPRTPSTTTIIKRNVEALCDKHGLTPTESLIVTELALTGLSNPQLAERVGRSGHTVSNHLKMIYFKTGAASREHLMVMLLRRVIDTEVRGKSKGQRASRTQ